MKYQAALDPIITDSGNWGDGGYPGSHVIEDSWYCSAQASFAPDPADGGSSSLAVAGEETVTLSFQTPVSFDAFQLAQNDGMGYNPMDFRLEGQVPGSSEWAPLLTVTGFDFDAEKAVHTFSLLGSTEVSATTATLTPPMSISGDFVQVPNGVPTTSDPGSPTMGQAVFVLIAATDTQITFDLLVHAPSGSEDSFWIWLDTEPPNERLRSNQNGARDDFRWLPVTGREFRLTAGTHTLHIGHRESGTQLKSIRITSGDAAFTSSSNEGGGTHRGRRLTGKFGGEFLDRRHLQFGAGLITPVEETCPMSVMNERFAEVDGVCCPPEHPCGGSPVPAACPVGCAIAWTALYSLCRDTLARVVSSEDSMAVFDTFSHTCISGVDVDELLAIARTATCGLESCMAHKVANPDAEDGLYPIANDGHTYTAYCDMTRGGWELVLRAASSDSVFVFDSSFWTNGELLNAESVEESQFSPLSDGDAKYPSFLYTPVNAIRGCLSGLTDADCKSYEDLDEASSALSLFTTAPIGSHGVQFSETLQEAQGWLEINQMSCSDTSNACNFAQAGINLADDVSQYQARVRLGLLTNNQADINTANDAIGFGCQEANGNGVAAGIARYPGGSEDLVASSGTIWVRGPVPDTVPVQPSSTTAISDRLEMPSCSQSASCAEGQFCGLECWHGPCFADRNVCQPCSECEADSDAVDGSCAHCGQQCDAVQIIDCSASSEYSDQYRCENSFDGQVAPRGGHGDAGVAWATTHEGVGSWITLTFAAPAIVDTMKFANRDAWGDSGEEASSQLQLTFSDGTSATIDLLPVENDDFDHYYSFLPKRTSSVTVTVTGVFGIVNNGWSTNTLCIFPLQCHSLPNAFLNWCFCTGAEEIAFFQCADADAYHPNQVWEVGGCGTWASVSIENPVEILVDQVYTIDSCAAACTSLDWCEYFFLGRASTGQDGHCIPVGPGCTQDGNQDWSCAKQIFVCMLFHLTQCLNGCVATQTTRLAG
eukprot:SAG31_NODE_1490_length_8134_cov_3.892968_3_plen_994_part_00